MEITDDLIGAAGEVIPLFPRTAVPTAQQIAKEQQELKVQDQQPGLQQQILHQTPYGPLANAAVGAVQGAYNWMGNLQRNVAIEDYVRSQSGIPVEAPERTSVNQIYTEVENLPATPGFSVSNILKQTAKGFVGATAGVDRELRPQDVVDASVGLTGIRATQALTRGPAALVNADAKGISTFIGTIPKNANVGTFERLDFTLRQSQAERALADGENPKTVWARTGFMNDSRNNLITEISDESFRFKPNVYENLTANLDASTRPLGEIVQHEEFFKFFPDASKIKVEVNPASDATDVSGAFKRDPRGQGAHTITVDIPPGAAKERVAGVLIHEMQHAAQYEDVMAGLSRATGTNAEFAMEQSEALFVYARDIRRIYGNTPTEQILQEYQKFRPQDYTTLKSAFQAEALIASYSKLYSTNDALRQHAGFAFYLANPGEVEARLTDARRLWGKSERRAIMPNFSEALDLQRVADERAFTTDRLIRSRSDKIRAEVETPRPVFGKRNAVR